MTTHPRFAVLVLVSLALAASACQPPIFLPEFDVDTSDTFSAVVDDAVIGADGDFIVTWTQFEPTGEVLGRHFDAQTTPLGDPIPLSIATTLDQRQVSIARDASGRFVTVWNEGFATQIRGRRFDADGTPLGGNFQINTSTPLIAELPHVASDPSGNFVVTWSSIAISTSDALARRFDSNGAPLGDEFRVNVFTPGNQKPSGIAMTPAGFVVTWTGSGPAGEALFGRRFDPSGNPIAGDFQINNTTMVSLLHPSDVAMNATGGFVAVWQDTDQIIRGRRYDSAGAPLGAVFPISAATATLAGEPRVASDSVGNFLVTWKSEPIPALGSGGDSPHIAGRFYDISGSSATNEFQVNQFTSGDLSRPRPSLADNGSFVVAFGNEASALSNVKARKNGVRASPNIVVDPLDPAIAAGGSVGNGVFEPGETVVPQTAWVNDTVGDVVDVLGLSELFTGPPGADYTLNDDMAFYGTISPGQTRSCLAEADCFSVTVSDPVTRPVQHWDALLQENTNMSLPHTWVLHLGESFPDVPTGHQFYAFIETLFHNSVTTGCAGGGYCPGSPVTRAQMAVFLLKGKFGSAHIPPPCTGTVFPDVPCTGGTFDPWIEELDALGITGGCGGGLYCPNNTVTRQQMAVFLLKAFEGSAYVPPACTGIFNDVTCTPGTGFSDWIEELSERGITGGCNITPPLYCPANPNNRGQMAVFLTKMFGLVLYGG